MLIYKKENENIIWGIWKIEEDTQTLLSSLSDTSFTRIITSDKRLREQTAVRVLLKALLNNEEKTIGYSANGKPYLIDGSYVISISHTRGYAAVVLAKQGRVGIDIEYISEKVKRVRSKFISDREYIDEPNETIHLLLHWSAKETMYKALGYSGVDLMSHLFVERFTPELSGVFVGYEKYTRDSHRFSIHYYVKEDYVLTMTFEEIVK